MTDRPRVVIGADTHLDTLHLAALTETGKPLADAEFGTRPTDYFVAIKWAQSFGEVIIAGVEGTGSYGAGFTRALQAADINVAEIIRYAKPATQLFDAHPRVKAWLDACQARPAFQAMWQARDAEAA